ncbi:MAG: two-component sensor histidine kinase [Eggerthellaceae bacterium]|nr:two-component sensor histidine kinase [Eggerthellaceae bacterium]
MGRAPSLSRRLFRAVLAFALAGIVTFSLVIAGICYASLERDAAARLAGEAQRAARLLDGLPVGEQEAMLAGQLDDAVRITLVAPDGAVLFDSATASQDLGGLPSHADRPEVRAALESGEGAAVRRSDTQGGDTVYAAAALADGSVVRLAETRESLVAFFLDGLVAPLAAALVIAAVLVLVLSRLLTRSLMRPLDQLDAARPLEGEAYAEMVPLLARIDSQQRTLRAQNEELARAESLRRDFSANVSHEMKTPLQVIAGYAELMANGMVPPGDVARFSGVIYEESQAMRALIDDVLTLSRLDEQGAGTAQAPVDLAGAAARAARRLAKPAADAGVSVEVDAEGPAMVRGSEALIEQMAYNLVDNAVRYNHPGGEVRVTVRLEDAAGAEAGAGARDGAGAAGAGGEDGEARAASGPVAVLMVDDTGPGIPPQAREKVFERFFRLDKSRSKETGGTGLGLAIVKHVALTHGGSVSAGDAPGGGTRLTVRLPAIAPGAE